MKQVGRELGVRYVLEGSVRKAAGRVRITGQLIDATTGRHVWADRFDGDLADVFELQDRVTESVVAAIEPSLLGAEIKRAQAKPTASLDAYDLYLRAVVSLRAGTREANDSGIALLQRAVEIDPSFTPAKGMLVQFHSNRVVQGWAEPSETEAAIALARQCLIGSRNNPLILSRVGLLLVLATNEREQGVALVERAIRMNPNSPNHLVYAGFAYCLVGQPERGINCLSRALQLYPLDPFPSRVLGGIGLAHLLAGRAQQALEYTERAVNSEPLFRPILVVRIAALAVAGRIEEAHTLAQKYIRFDPNFRISSMPMKFDDGIMLENFRNALLAAGLPE